MGLLDWEGEQLSMVEPSDGGAALCAHKKKKHMRIVTKKIKVIQMSAEEHATFLDCLQRAKDGQMSHYAESKLEDGTFLGVSILTSEQEQELKKQRLQREDEQRMSRDQRHEPRNDSWGSRVR